MMSRRSAALALVSLALGPVRSGLARSEQVVPREVLVCYYGWWGSDAAHRGNGWRHWGCAKQGGQPAGDPGSCIDPTHFRIGSSTDYPIGYPPADGPYDSLDTNVVSQQLAAMRGAGITGLIASFWGPNSYTDKSLALLTKLAPTQKLKVTVAIPQVDNGTPGERYATLISWLRYVLDGEGGRGGYARSPAFLRVGGRPALFLNEDMLSQLWQLDPSASGLVQTLTRLRADVGTPIFLVGNPYATRRKLWGTANPYEAGLKAADQELLRSGALDAVYNYSLNPLTAQIAPRPVNSAAVAGEEKQLQGWASAYYANEAGLARRAGNRVTVSVVFPGHDKSRVRPDAPVTDWLGGRTYSALWRGAIKGGADWVVIVSWNEWHEGTQIEASREFGNLGLDITRTFADQFLALPAQSRSLP